jgi:hypothetical protein
LAIWRSWPPSSAGPPPNGRSDASRGARPHFRAALPRLTWPRPRRPPPDIEPSAGDGRPPRCGRSPLYEICLGSGVAALPGGWRQWLLIRIRGMNAYFPRLAASQILPIAQNTIGKVGRAGFRMGTPNGSYPHAPESLSHFYVNSSMVADPMSADWRHAAPRFSFIASWLVPFALPAPSLSPPRWLRNASAPSPPRPAARLTAARNKRRREASDQR